MTIVGLQVHTPPNFEIGYHHKARPKELIVA
jgi:hypothetical protein